MSSVIRASRIVPDSMAHQEQERPGNGLGVGRRGNEGDRCAPSPPSRRPIAQDAGDARDQLRRSGTLRLFGAAVRLRAAHGTTYARALGHSSLLTLIPDRGDRARRGLRPRRVRAGARGRCSLVRAGPGRKHPDPSARSRGSPRGRPLFWWASPGCLFSGTVGMTHLERAADRITASRRIGAFGSACASRSRSPRPSR